MKGKKLLILFFALLSPVVIFLFLKSFGKNEFDVPVLHADGSIMAPDGCDFDYPTPYRVADTLMLRLGANENDSLYVLYFDTAPSTIDRVAQEFGTDPVQLIAVAGDDIDRQLIRHCALLMPADSSVALLDNRYRIRGYYNGDDRDEADRLMVEIKILLKQY